MDLANMRANGIRSLRVTCLKCQVARVVNMDGYDGSWAVTLFGPRMLCKACGARGADVRPNWTEQPVHLPPLR